MAFTVPETITVHLGVPTANAANVTVTFPDYIKNVASSEIYPTWPENAIRANIYAQVSFALNRIYTEWYRSQGYGFDITSTSQFDQSFFYGRDIFDNISQLVDEMFNDYIRREQALEPLFAAYCDGIKLSCNGLSQWGTVTLAKQGLVPFDILRTYYGDNIELVFNAPISPNIPSYTGILTRGNYGESVRRIQNQLNRISVNYPSIPKAATDGVYNIETENAVKEFQRIFNLAVDGIIGPSTWYRLQYVYTSVKRLAELESEGDTLLGSMLQYPRPLSEGDTGDSIRILQYFLSLLSQYYRTIPFLTIDGIFGLRTKAALLAAQEEFGLPETGTVNQAVWDRLVSEVETILATIPTNQLQLGVQPYPGYEISLGVRGAPVVILQTYLTRIAETYPEIPTPPLDGDYEDSTRNAVVAFQQLFELIPDGVVGPITWKAVASLYGDLIAGDRIREGQFPGATVSPAEDQR